MSEKITFSKIVLKTGDKTTVQLIFVAPTEAGSENHDVTSRDVPLDSFIAAMRKLDGHVGYMCDFLKEYADGCQVQTVSLSDQRGGIGLVLSARKDLGNGKVFNFNTPRYDEAADDEPSEFSLGRDTINAIRVLIKEANRYRLGERSQIGMFEGEKDGQKE